jgi:hypothetical protein
LRLGKSKSENSVARVDVLGEPMRNLEGLLVAPVAVRNSVDTDLILNKMTVASVLTFEYFPHVPVNNEV